MKMGMTRLIALLMALLLALSVSALAAETVSDGFRVDGAQERPEEPVEGEAEGEPQTGSEMPEAPDATKEPVEIPAEPIGKKQVCLNSDSDSVKIFESADSASPVVGNAFHGDVVDVFASVDGWTYIQMGGTKGWIASGHLKEVGSADTPEPTATPEPTPEPTPVPVPAEPVGQKQVCLNNATDSVNLFAQADGASEVVGALNHGDVVDVYVEAGAWTLVRADDLEGWIASAHLKAVGSAEPEATPEPEATEEPEATPEPEATEEPEATVEPEATEEPEEVPSYEYERDEDGNLVLDESGNPIPVLPEDATEKPVVFQRDEDGNLVLDENGNPIPVQFVPVEAEKIDSEPDAENPNRHVDIYADFGGDMLTMGQQLNLIAAFDGYDGLEYAIQWQTSMDDATWTDVEGATSATLPVVVTEETYVSYWRVEVTITGVIGAEATEPEEAEAAPAAEAEAAA